MFNEIIEPPILSGFTGMLKLAAACIIDKYLFSMTLYNIVLFGKLVGRAGTIKHLKKCIPAYRSTQIVIIVDYHSPFFSIKPLRQKILLTLISVKEQRSLTPVSLYQYSAEKGYFLPKILINVNIGKKDPGYS
ncbi:MAG: hypothetical protein GXZ09_10010 [Syntrophomonadaceae bacterium]|nr:hypothetical protein [Syntrophomonadaceae bacterium]